MRAQTFFCAWPVLLAACAVSAQAPAHSQQIASSDTYRGMAPPDQTFANPLSVAQAFTGGYSSSAEVGPVIKVRVDPHPDSDGRAIVTASAEPLLDDSIKAEEWVAIIVPEDGRWRVETLAIRFKCWRATEQDKWTTDLCP